MTTVAVVGLGLMGGSLLRTLSGSAAGGVGWSPDPEERAAAGKLPGVRVPDGLGEAIRGVDGIVVATPLSALGGILDEVVAESRARWVTDVCSLQAPPLAAAAARGLAPVYVTSHPMVGGHRSGFEASREGLYGEAPVWLSAPGEGEAGDAVLDFWAALGARPAWVDAGEHDRRMAWASHLPQVVSAHLAAVLADAGLARSELGPGGRDLTRLAGSDPRMWADILEAAAPGPLPEALRILAARLRQEADRLDQGAAAEFSGLLRRTGPWSRS